ncbi:hypothetical protein L208DRAFT_1549854 [Tricholoma matsutake]|nr:hypothetical protein L208DRAFT_1549854 [Tricholoma matsutake 945]
MHWMARTPLELVPQSGLGYSMDSLTEDSVLRPNGTAAKELVPVLFSTIFPQNHLITTLVKPSPPSFRRFLLDLLPMKNVHQLRDIGDTMHDMAVEILEEALKEGHEAVARQIDRGKDIIGVLMKANMEASEEDRLPDEEVLVYARFRKYYRTLLMPTLHYLCPRTLIFAAMDTVCRLLDLLATSRNPGSTPHGDNRSFGEEWGKSFFV